MAKKINQKKENIEEKQDETLPPMDDFSVVEETSEEIPELEEIKDDGIKEILQKKKKMSEKQKNHVSKLVEQRKRMEKVKKDHTKKMEKLLELGYDVDDLIQNGEKNKLKKEYERVYGKNENENEIPKNIENIETQEIRKPVENVNNVWFSWK